MVFDTASTPTTGAPQSHLNVPCTVQQNVPSWGLDRLNERARVLDGEFSHQSDAPRVNVYVLDSGIETANILSDGDGRFVVANVAPGKYQVSVALEGFVTFAVQATVTAGVNTTVTVDLPIASLSDTVTVIAPTPIVSSADTISTSAAIDNKETDRLSPGSGLQGALRLRPDWPEVHDALGVVLGHRGNLLAARSEFQSALKARAVTAGTGGRSPLKWAPLSVVDQMPPRSEAPPSLAT